MSHPSGGTASGYAEPHRRDTFIVTTKQAALMCTQGAAHLLPMPLCHVRTGGTLHFQGDFTLPGCGPQHPLGIQTA